MNLEHYLIEAASDFLEYQFYSEGPNGIIKKVVRFTKINIGDFTYYNLGFGAWNEITNTIDDFIISNNQDAEQVLATVATTVLLFTKRYPDSFVYAEGSTHARTRRYQMGINKYYNDIKDLFEIFGLIDDIGFVPFKQGINFLAFLVRRKTVNFII